MIGGRDVERAGAGGRRRAGAMDELIDVWTSW